jgi:hypothetical protein
MNTTQFRKVLFSPALAWRCAPALCHRRHQSRVDRLVLHFGAQASALGGENELRWTDVRNILVVTGSAILLRVCFAIIVVHLALALQVCRLRYVMPGNVLQ